MESRRRILIAEDEALVALDIESRLTALGFEVVGKAATYDEVTEAVRELHPDLVLMDISLRGERDGIAAAEQLRLGHAIPVVFLTAFADSATLDRAKRASPYGYIVKPYDERDLRTTIEIALHRDGLDRALRRSQEDLLAVLDVQRTGLLLLDPGGRVRFANAVARSMRGAPDEPLADRSWTDVLGLDESRRAAVQAMLRRPPAARDKVAARIASAGAGERDIEIEVEDDPRDGAGWILLLTDVSDVHRLRRMLEDHGRFHDIVGRSEPIRRIVQQIRDVARVDATVLIEGETGTGKELVARAIHFESARRDGPFVAVNCAGLSDELAASQLFGHRRGAFTGASSDSVGVFEAAARGTLFLDEVGDLSPRVQTSLLRVLEERVVTRLGDTRPRPVDVRIVAATASLTREVTEGRFRSDLLYRLRVGRIHLPPLRERRDDLWLLVRHALAEHRATTGRSVDRVSEDAMRAVLAYDWPGNVRELKNTLGYAVIHCHGSVIELEDLPPELLESAPAAPTVVQLPVDERERIVAALERTAGERKAAAALLGMSRATLYRKLAQHGIT